MESKTRKKLLKTGTAKYYSRKSKIEEALASLVPSNESQEDYSFLSELEEEIPSKFIGKQALYVPMESKSWCVSATRNEIFSLPFTITEASSANTNIIKESLTPEIWSRIPLEKRKSLMELLPTFSNQNETLNKSEKEKTLQYLLAGDNFHFGNPIEQFFEKLKKRDFHPKNRKEIEAKKVQQQTKHIQYIQHMQEKTIKRAMQMRRALNLGETHHFLLYTPETSHISLKDIEYASSDTDVDSAIEEELSEGDKKDLQVNLSRAIGTRAMMAYQGDNQITDEELQQSMLGKRGRGQKLLYDNSEDEVVPAGPVWIFFASLRNLFMSNNFEFTIEQLEDQFKKDPERIASVLSSFSLRQFLLLGLHFLQAPPSFSESERKKRGKAQAEVVVEPTEANEAAQAAKERSDAEKKHVTGNPFVRLDKDNVWRWIGAFTDPAPLEEFSTLELIFYYVVTRIPNINETSIANYVVVKQQKCASTIRPTTPEEEEDYQKQELARYLSPEKPFFYSFRGHQCIVAPLKRGLGNQSQKAREHFLLKNDRPPHISLLCLMRDAAARLPGGIGTRPDVAILLKDSQFVVHDVPENKLNSVISGALDRLQAQADPCVRFDGEQKMWVYLHRRRTEENFPIITPKKKVKRTNSGSINL